MRDGFGWRVEFARRSLGVSQTELAGKLKVQQKTVSAWESSDTATIQQGNLERLAEALGTTVAWLEDGIVPTPPRPGEGPTYISVNRHVRDAIRLLEGVLAETDPTRPVRGTEADAAGVLSAVEKSAGRKRPNRKAGEG